MRLEQDREDRDAYNRRLAYVLRDDGVFVNAVLVREGLARISARLPLARLAELQQAEREARGFRRGMWGAMPAVPFDTDTRGRSAVARKPGGRYTANSTPPKRQKASGGKRRRRQTS